MEIDKSEEKSSFNMEHPAIKPFIKAAREYCKLVESYSAYTPLKFLRLLNKSFANLYYNTLLLPSIPPIDYNTKEDIVSKSVYNTIVKYLGSYDIYYNKFMPTKPDDQVIVQGSLADDISGIYSDLKAYLYFDDNDLAAQQDSLWHMQYNFRYHWGRHLVSAQRAVHDFLEEEYWTEPD